MILSICQKNLLLYYISKHFKKCHRNQLAALSNEILKGKTLGSTPPYTEMTTIANAFFPHLI